MAQSGTKRMQSRYINRKNALTVAIVAAVFVAFCCFVALFAQSYHELSESIQQERTDYVSEISKQIITSQQFMESEYSDTVRNYAAILSSCQAKSRSDLRNHLHSSGNLELLLVDAEGKITDLDGTAVFLTDRSLPQSLYDSEGIVQLFTSLNNAEDYWLFAAPVEPVAVGDKTYTAIVLAVPSDEYRDSLAISLFDNRGASYIIRQDGSIVTKPEDTKVTFSGYNLFSSMLRAGADKDAIDSLREGVEDSESGDRLLSIGDELWLVSYSEPNKENRVIVVAIPLSITAAQTYDGLDNTIIFAVLIALSIALIALLLILIFFQRDRERSREAMAVAAKSDFFSKMGHDIRTPLNAIIGMEALARDNIHDPEVAEDYLSKSSTAANYLLGIINDVLDMRRIESGKLTIANTPFDMNTLLAEVRSVIAPTAAEKSLSFEVEIDSPFATACLGDSVRVKQILMNLLSNAVKFTESGGQIKLKVAHSVGEGARHLVTFIVSDTGIGMSQAFMDRMFAPFEQEHSSYTAQHAGSGLGLSIVHNLISMMDGVIEVESREGEGTAFTVILSFASGDKISGAERAAEIPLSSFPGKRALVVEDNEVNQQIAVSLLTRKFAMDVEVAADGKQALELFSAVAPGYFDIILMDIKMPVMGGLESARLIRSLAREDAGAIPIIALSANAYEEDIALSIEAGMNYHLAKPIDVKSLSLLLDEYIGE